MALSKDEKDIVQPLAEAVTKTFSIQFSTPVEILSIDHSETQTLEFEIAAIMSISSSTYTGIVALCFPQSTFLALVERMLLKKYTTIDSNNADAAGEMLNIIYGVARLRINRDGFDFFPAIPSVVRGKSLIISHISGSPCIVVSCKSESGPFALEISLKKTGEIHFE